MKHFLILFVAMALFLPLQAQQEVIEKKIQVYNNPLSCFVYSAGKYKAEYFMGGTQKTAQFTTAGVNGGYGVSLEKRIQVSANTSVSYRVSFFTAIADGNGKYTTKEQIAYQFINNSQSPQPQVKLVYSEAGGDKQTLSDCPLKTLALYQACVLVLNECTKFEEKSSPDVIKLSILSEFAASAILALNRTDGNTERIKEAFGPDIDTVTEPHIPQTEPHMIEATLRPSIEGAEAFENKLVELVAKKLINDDMRVLETYPAQYEVKGTAEAIQILKRLIKNYHQIRVRRGSTTSDGFTQVILGFTQVILSPSEEHLDIFKNELGTLEKKALIRKVRVLRSMPPKYHFEAKKEAIKQLKDLINQLTN